VQKSGDDFVELARAYKRINAPVGELGMASLKVSTAALAGNYATMPVLRIVCRPSRLSATFLPPDV